MTRHPFFTALLLFSSAAILFIFTGPPLQQQVCHTPFRDIPEVWKRRLLGRNSHRAVYFAAAFKVPVASHVVGFVSRVHGAITSCGNGISSSANFSQCPSRRSAASPSRLHQQHQLRKQSSWILRASSATPSRALGGGGGEAAPAASDLLSGARGYRTPPTPATAVVTSASGGALPTLAMNRRAAAFERPVTKAPLSVTLLAVSQTNVPRETSSTAESMLRGTIVTAGTATMEKDSYSTATAATDGTQEKTPGTAAPLGPVVTRKDLVASLTAELQLPRADVERTIAALLRHITANLEVGRKVSISKFGTFNVRRRGERTARNPRTGDTLSVAAATFPTFSFSKVLKERVRDVVPIDTQEENDEEAET